MKEQASIPILRVGETLLASVQAELRDATADRFQEDVLLAIRNSGTAGLILDVSGLEIVDSYVARILVDTARMAKLMGTETIVAGIRPEVAATLVRMGYMMEGVRTALDINHALALLEAGDGGDRSKG